MNNINRVLVKQQAKQLIKDKVFILFVISAVALMLTTGLGASTNIILDNNSLSDLFQNKAEDNYDYEDFFGNEFGNYPNGSNQNSNDSGNPIDSFGNGNNSSNNSSSFNQGSFSRKLIPSFPFRLGVSSGLLNVIGTVLSPLLITLFGFYIAFVRKNPQDELKLGAELGHLFKVSFNGTYIKKLVLYLLVTVIQVVLTCCLLVPGIIFYYSSYFSYQLMCEFPNLKPSEAIKLSRKIVRGNRTELFVLDLSFFWWYILCGVTCGIALVYVIPYIMTTRALYYENFRIRALEQGRITQDDFLSAEELAQRFYQGGTAQNYAYSNGSQYYYNPQSSNTQGSNANYAYESRENNSQGSYTEYQPVNDTAQQNIYNESVVEEQPVQPTQDEYQAPTDDAE